MTVIGIEIPNRSVGILKGSRPTDNGEPCTRVKQGVEQICPLPTLAVKQGYHCVIRTSQLNFQVADFIMIHIEMDIHICHITRHSTDSSAIVCGLLNVLGNGELKTPFLEPTLVVTCIISNLQGPISKYAHTFKQGEGGNGC